MERRDRGPKGWPRDCYCNKYGPDGAPHPVKNKEEHYNHKRRYARRNVIQANLHLHRSLSGGVDEPEVPSESEGTLIQMGLDESSALSLHRRNNMGLDMGNNSPSSQRSDTGVAYGMELDIGSNSPSSQRSGIDTAYSMELDEMLPLDSDGEEEGEEGGSGGGDDDDGITIEPEDLDAGNWERYADARVHDQDYDNPDIEDEMRLEFPELFEPGDDDGNISTGTESGTSSLSNDVGFGTRILNHGVDIDTPNIAMLRELNVDYPYGQTTFMDIPPDTAREFDYFRVKVQHNMPNSAFEDMMKVGNLTNPELGPISSNTVASVLGTYTAINHVRYDCCQDNCLCFADWPDDESCPICGKNRFADGTTDTPRKSYSTFDYIPITHRLRLLWANTKMALKMKTYVSHRHQMNEDNPLGVITDFWDGQLFKDLHKKGFFSDERDIALSFSTDGLQLFKVGTYDVWPLLVMITNLPPTERVMKDNMLLLGLVPGPKKPIDLDSFLRPFIDELKLLLEGVETTDGSSGETFRMKAHLTVVTADLPAMATLTATRGANAYGYCQFCRIRGTYCKSKRHIYCPLIPPTDIDQPPAAAIPESSSSSDSDVDNILPQQYDPRQLPHWTDDEFRLEAATIADEENTQIGKLSGINSLSVFAELPTIQFPRSFPIDIMHLVYEGLAQQMVNHWRGVFFTGHAATSAELECVIPTKIWKQIGEELASSRAEFPTAFGCAPRDITKFKFKASEWKNWVSILSPIYLKGRLPDKYYTGWMGYVEAANLMQKWVLNNEEIDRMEVLLADFVEHYEAEYYRYESKRLSACRATIHYQLHIAQCVRDLGPPGTYWQFPMERQCGYLTRMIKSRAAANRNLSLGILHMTRLSFLKVVYPSIRFTKTTIDSSDSLEVQELTGISNRDEPDTMVAGSGGLAPRVYTNDIYARQNVVLTHYHWRGPSKSCKFDKHEINALNSFIRHSYSTIYQQIGRIRYVNDESGVSATQYSNCCIDHQRLGSKLMYTRVIGPATSRSSSIVMYTFPEHAYGIQNSIDYINSAVGDRTFVGRARFYACITVPGVVGELFLAFLERQNVGRPAGHPGLFLIEGSEQNTSVKVDCVDIRSVYELMGLVQSGGKKWLCTRTTSVIQ